MQKLRFAERILRGIIRKTAKGVGTTKEETNNRQVVRYIASLVLYGTNGVAASFISKTSLEIVLLRTLLGCLLLAAVFYAKGGRLRGQARRDLLFVALSGAAMGFDWLLLFEAYARIGVSLGMILNYCGPVLVMLAAHLFFREQLTASGWSALALSMAGAALISFQGAASVDAGGLACAVLSAFAYAAMVLLNRQAAGFQGLGRVVVQLASALLTVLLYAAVKGGADLRIAPGEIWAVLWLGILNTGFASVWYFTSIERLPVREVSVLGYLEPLSALVCSAVMLRETMRPVQILGAGLILGGTLLQRKKK